MQIVKLRKQMFFKKEISEKYKMPTELLKTCYFFFQCLVPLRNIRVLQETSSSC